MLERNTRQTDIIESMPEAASTGSLSGEQGFRQSAVKSGREVGAEALRFEAGGVYNTENSAIDTSMSSAEAAPVGSMLSREVTPGELVTYTMQVGSTISGWRQAESKAESKAVDQSLTLAA